MPKQATESQNETSRQKLEGELTEELTALQQLLPRFMNSEPNRFEGPSKKPINLIRDNDARLLIKALQTIRESLTKAEKLAEPVPESIYAGLAVVASEKFPSSEVRKDLGTVTDTTRASAENILKL